MIHFVKELAAGPLSFFLAWRGNVRVALFTSLAAVALARHVEHWTGTLYLNTDMAEVVSGCSTGSLGFSPSASGAVMCPVSCLRGTAMKWEDI